MLTIHALDRGAEDREKLVRWLHSLISEDTLEIEYLPRIDIKPVALDELKFQGTPDICIIGSKLLEVELTQLGKIRKSLPRTPLIACTSPSIESLAHIEQIARLGANDTISSEITSKAFIRKLILLSKNKSEKDHGKLIVVDSGKGGLGVTTIAGALGEVSALEGNRTALVDLDFETQDLSRFLQVRPFVNENLQLLLEGSRPITDEFVDHCTLQVWEDEENLFHVAPPPASDLLYSGDTKFLRRFLSFLEALDEKFDVVIVDAGSICGAMQKTLYRVADEVVFVLNSDPAALYPSVDRLKKIQEALSPSAKLTLVDNDNGGDGLSKKMLRSEFSRVTSITKDRWSEDTIPHCKIGTRWPGSGSTFSSLAKAKGRDAVEKLACFLGLTEKRASEASRVLEFIKGLRPKAATYITKHGSIQLPTIQKKQKALPLPEIKRSASKIADDNKALIEDGDDEHSEKLIDFISEDSSDDLGEVLPPSKPESDSLISKAILQ